MATIVFCVHPIAGSVNASLKIAKNLQEQGHHIYYIGLKECEKFVHPNGFEFISCFETWFTKVGIETEGKPFIELSFAEKINAAKKFTRKMQNFIHALMSGADVEFFAAMDTLKPDLIIVVATHYDSFIWALLAHKAGIKTIYLHDTLCNSKSSGCPPIISYIIPEDSLFGQIKKYLAWQKFFYSERLWKWFYACFGVDIIDSHYKVKELAAHYDYSVELIETATDMLAPKLKLPELVLCPKTFEFPNIKQVERYYTSASIDLNRSQVNFPWEKLKEQPFVYCALGSLEHINKQDYLQFYQTVIDVAKLYNQWIWVIVIGQQLTMEDFQEIPENVILVNKAPQLELLKRASLMINHGGTNTIKECILYGVPMLVFPLAFDQAGNTARVVYHGLGLKGNFKTLTVMKLQKMITQISNNSYYRIQMTLMQQKFIEAETAQPELNIIDAILNIDGKTL
jgi:zeaxanthin glucosyltransferase